jgi:hypothetical protein
MTTSSSAPSPRRRFQFRLRTLMIGVTLLAVPCAYVGWQAKIVRERRALLDEINAAGGGEVPADIAHRPPWLRRILGDENVGFMVVPYTTDGETMARIFRLFPDVPTFVGHKEHDGTIVIENKSAKRD